ncbi:tyrosine-type recombinase/integrase [Hymenobacter endophyticus]|uniref:Tyrosine-type recombinase/integrase n=1 Tax=Hymenobacter endophyticus TaxID=3076335 RepID=A0ABU3TCJ3_9BACT|nr:tyrosine-type recombinase/integrase [Hymenobacter endophyticus]MDU0369097.1 tyrosine-type recombinase/integrase [Hymenobacter endophyticus]
MKHIDHMAVRDLKTETAPLAWSDFESLMSKLTYTAQVGGETSLYRMLLFAAVTTYGGLRAGDVLKLKWVDILDKKCITIKEGKTGKVREIALNTNLLCIIQLSYQLAIPSSNDHYIIPSASSYGRNPLSLQYMNRWLKSIFKRFGITTQNGSTHTFRKTFGRRVFEINNRSEEALITLSQVFNHSSIAITRAYIGLKKEKIADVYMSL